MQEMADMDLLRQYLEEDSEDAFATLVSRYVNLVYSAALRKTGNSNAAEEITQVVFVILAKKAPRLRPQTVLSGWLYQTARLTASSYLRTEIRRAHREQEAYMQSLADETGPDLWPQMAPLLDDAMGRLGERERNAVVLRFFEGKSFQEIGAAVGATENAARKRVQYALEKLQRYFSRRGISSTTAIIAGAISTHSVQAAPVTLAKIVTAVGIAKGAAASTSTLTLIKGALKMMAWAKAKTAVVVGAGLLVAAGTTTVVVEKAISPAVDESFWEAKVENLHKAPPVLIIRPTRFSDNIMVVGGTNQTMSRTIAHNLDVAGLIQFAYACYSRPKLVLPAAVPTNRFDLMLTLRTNQLEMLQQAIQRQFGLTAHREIRETEALRLQVKDPGLLALHASKPGSKMNFTNGANFVSFFSYPIDSESETLAVFFSKPVVLEPGLSGKNYDLTYRWENPDDIKPAVSRELAQAGLELVPTNLPIEMLVVEKVK
jgi:uncharacterized protein (TIGR03435 family)